MPPRGTNPHKAHQTIRAAASSSQGHHPVVVQPRTLQAGSMRVADGGWGLGVLQAGVQATRPQCAAVRC